MARPTRPAAHRRRHTAHAESLPSVPRPLNVALVLLGSLMLALAVAGVVFEQPPASALVIAGLGLWILGGGVSNLLRGQTAEPVGWWSKAASLLGGLFFLGLVALACATPVWVVTSSQGAELAVILAGQVLALSAVTALGLLVARGITCVLNKIWQEKSRAA